MKLKKILSFLLLAVITAGCTTTPSNSTSSSNKQTTSQTTASSSSSSNSSSTIGSSSSSEVEAELKGEKLKLHLRNENQAAHKKQTTYGELRDEFINSDKGPDGKMRTFYAHASFSGVWDSGNTWDREHVWPKASSWFTKVSNSDKGAGADLHHIRPTITTINNRRGNLPFGDFDESSATKVAVGEHLGGYISNGHFEPLDHTKGDVARILFYLVTRYSESDNYPITKVAQSYEMLLEWNKLDPVDEWEMNRNNYVETIQGNRNPFIDNPEYANLIWGNL